MLDAVARFAGLATAQVGIDTRFAQPPSPTRAIYVRQVVPAVFAALLLFASALLSQPLYWYIG